MLCVVRCLLFVSCSMSDVVICLLCVVCCFGVWSLLFGIDWRSLFVVCRVLLRCSRCVCFVWCVVCVIHCCVLYDCGLLVVCLACLCLRLRFVDWLLRVVCSLFVII